MICVCVSVYMKLCVCLHVCLCPKEYAMRDSNPQPPDSKSDTLSIAPTAPRKRYNPHKHTQISIKRTTNYEQHTHKHYNTQKKTPGHTNTLQTSNSKLQTPHSKLCLHPSASTLTMLTIHPRTNTILHSNWRDPSAVPK